MIKLEACGPAAEIGSPRISESHSPDNGISRWRRTNLDIYSQNNNFGLVYDMIRWYINFVAWRQIIITCISLVCFANNVIHPWPQVMPIFDREMPPRFTPAICLCRNFVFISTLENRGADVNPLGKTSEILFWIVMPTFGKICHRPWLHGLKNQS